VVASEGRGQGFDSLRARANDLKGVMVLSDRLPSGSFQLTKDSGGYNSRQYLLYLSYGL
jgi:hypothetical protein